MRQTDALRVGDEVELIHDLSARARVLRAGARGTVLCTDLPWHAVSVELAEANGLRRLFQLRTQHLRKVGRAR